jgi:hypothetical protein
MKHVHEVLGVGVLGANAVVAAWGTTAWLRGTPSTIFWYLLRVAQVLVVIEAVAGVVLTSGGTKVPDKLHYVYGIAPLVVSLVTEFMRAGARQTEVAAAGDIEALDRADRIRLARRIVLREIGIMTVGAILIVTLALRAAQSGGLF